MPLHHHAKKGITGLIFLDYQRQVGLIPNKILEMNLKLTNQQSKHTHHIGKKEIKTHGRFTRWKLQNIDDGFQEEPN